jgi:hypothetical protein
MTMRKLLAFGVCAAVSVLVGELARAEDAKPRPGQGIEKQKPRPAAGESSRGASQADTPEDAESRRIRDEDERKASDSKEKMKKRPGYKEDAPAPRASGGTTRIN